MFIGDVAVMVAVPTAFAVARPPEFIDTIAAADELQLTEEVKFCVELSL